MQNAAFLMSIVVLAGFVVALTYVFLVKRRLSRRDPVFGPMRFIPSQPGMWVADEAPLQAVQLTIQVVIDADREGPSAEQREFFAGLERRYPALLSEVARLANVQRENLRLIAADIPKGGDASLEWETTWGGAKEPFSVEMRGWSAFRIAPACSGKGE